MAASKESSTYEFVEELAGGTNLNFIIRERATSAVWACKIFKNSKSFAKDHADLNDRAVLAHRLAMKTGTCVPEVRLIDASQVAFSPAFDTFLTRYAEDTIMQRKLLLEEFGGLALENFLKIAKLSKIRNLEQVLHNLVFNVWIGNYDSKEHDYVVNNDLICHSIDYSLTGPGFVDDYSLSIGAYFQTYDFDNVTDTGWAIADVLLDEIKHKRYTVDFFHPLISVIEGLDADTIKDAFKGLNFYRFGTTARINAAYIEFLLARKEKLRSAVNAWCEAHYPKGKRIPGI
ncbi:MAG: hypothetical protein AB1805_12865 [Nitrospirota bacterium]